MKKTLIMLILGLALMVSPAFGGRAPSDLEQFSVPQQKTEDIEKTDWQKVGAIAGVSGVAIAALGLYLNYRRKK